MFSDCFIDNRVKKSRMLDVEVLLQAVFKQGLSGWGDLVGAAP